MPSGPEVLRENAVISQVNAALTALPRLPHRRQLTYPGPFGVKWLIAGGLH